MCLSAPLKSAFRTPTRSRAGAVLSPSDGGGELLWVAYFQGFCTTNCLPTPGGDLGRRGGGGGGGAIAPSPPPPPIKPRLVQGAHQLGLSGPLQADSACQPVPGRPNYVPHVHRLPSRPFLLSSASAAQSQGSLTYRISKF